MATVIKINGIYGVVDPLDYYNDYPTCVEACGLIPSFVTKETTDIVNHMEAMYGFPLTELGGLVTNEGVYQSEYPEDEDLFPYMVLRHFDTNICIYPYGIVGFVLNKDGEQSQFITRMD